MVNMKGSKTEKCFGKLLHELGKLMRKEWPWTLVALFNSSLSSGRNSDS